MLQWMGGSRRKVTTSLKSTHKRQKQYFEQRKQQQQHESAWKDGSSDITNKCTQRSINSQSLDILSLRDLNTVAEENKSSRQAANESLDGNVLKWDCGATPELPKMHTSQAAPADWTKCRGESYQLKKTVDRERSSKNFHGSHYKDLSGSGKVEPLEMPNDLKLSVLDLLGDDGPNSNPKGNSLHEAHVAFSVEGLGKVGMETPVQSPQRPVRDFPYGCSLSSRGTENNHPVKNFMSRQDDLAAKAIQDYLSEDDDILYDEINLPSRFMMDSFSYPEHEKVMGKRRLQMIDNGSYSKNGVGNKYIFNNEYGNDDMWAESSTLLDDDFLCKSKCHSSWKTQPYQINPSSPDYFNFESHVENEFGFQGASVYTSRGCTEEMNTFDIFDSVTPYAKHQLSENHPDFTNSKGTWHPDLGRPTPVRSVINQPARPSFETEDERESLGFLSEDSCSSSSAWYKSAGNPQFDLLGKKMKAPGSEYCCLVRKKGVKNKYGQELHGKKQENLQRKDYIHESGNCPIPTACFHKRKGPHKNWLFEDEDVTGSRNSGLGSFCYTSGLEDSQPSSFQDWNEDLYNVDSVNATFVSKRSRGNARYPIRGTVCQDDIPLCERDRLYGKNENELKVSEPSSDKSELQEDACDGSNCLSSENKNIGDPLDAGDSCSHFNVAKDRSQEMGGCRETCSPEQAEYVSSIKILEAPDSIESDLEGKMKEDNVVSSYQKNVQTHPSQNRCKDIEESVPKERNLGSKKQKNITESSSLGMVLESYAIQLLSVHVRKEASNWGIGKKEN